MRAAVFILIEAVSTRRRAASPTIASQPQLLFVEIRQVIFHQHHVFFANVYFKPFARGGEVGQGLCSRRICRPVAFIELLNAFRKNRQQDVNMLASQLADNLVFAVVRRAQFNHSGSYQESPAASALQQAE